MEVVLSGVTAAVYWSVCNPQGDRAVESVLQGLTRQSPIGLAPQGNAKGGIPGLCRDLVTQQHSTFFLILPVVCSSILK